jgi:protein-disulfide isomerase
MPKQSKGGSTSGRARAQEITRAQAAQEKRRRLLWQLGAFVTVAVVVLLVTVGVLANQGGSSETVEGAPAGVSKDGGIFVGAEDAPVTLTMVEDFQCPVCRDFEAANKSLLDSYAAGSDVRLEYRPIAFLDRMSSTDYSSRALNAAACFQAAEPEKWRDYHDLLFDNQPPEQSAGLSDDELVSLAVEAGASKSDMQSCVDDMRYQTWVESTTEVNTNAPGFEGTPSVSVNGEPVDNPTPEGIKAAVDAASSK